MDHKNFETHMIDFVNRNAQVKEEVWNQTIREEQETAGHRRRCKTINAAVESLVLIAAWVCLTVVMFYAHWTNFVPAEYVVVICSAFGFIVGVRINTLVARIKRYGGR